GLRVASMTGLPTLVGQHQYEQRPAEEVASRTEEGIQFFRTTNLDEARRLLKELHVGYIYVGPLERLLFSQNALAKFDALAEKRELRIAYRNPGVVIYEVAANVAN
ncbi:MAG: hypothetical protein ACM30E_07150, partial [Nitrososphaerales archaeon]